MIVSQARSTAASAWDRGARDVRARTPPLPDRRLQRQRPQPDRRAQRRRGYPTSGVTHADVDFAAASAGFGAWSRRVNTLDGFEAAVREAFEVNRPAVIDAVVDPTEYLAHHPRPQAARR
ncbi:MAG TPA: thiamine pyrophosphate-dependent enzyme [Vicinamibacterales bacterium]|jgi:thiamine pyrophosphate-dependent acetolactate synthase large subunit-like protein